MSKRANKVSHVPPFQSSKIINNYYNYSQSEELTLEQAMPDTAWDDLNDLYNNCCKLLRDPPMEVVSLLKDRERVSQLRQFKEVVLLAKVLDKDITTYKNKLMEIHIKHYNKRGSSQNEDEFIETITIGEEYTNWVTSYESVVIPIIEDILTLFALEETDCESI